MTLIQLESGRTVLIDVRIRAAADDPDDDTPDVAKMLRERLRRDPLGRPYADAFLLSHPDQDHCLGLDAHFHLGPLADYPKGSGKIVLRELWSSPIVFRRASRLHVLCDDAKAFCAEARRRVAAFRKFGAADDGDRILILGEDEDGKTDDLASILVRVDETFSKVSGAWDASMTARLLAPHPKSGDEQEEEARAKNRSSTILNFSLTGGSAPDAGRFLSAGDAEVAVWERLWERHKHQTDRLRYDILQAPHHCSWHSLSHESWSEKGQDAEVSRAARSALSQTRTGATVVATSRAIKDDGCDPPCIGAKREYEAIVAGARGSFRCVGEHPSEAAPGLMEFEVGRNGPRLLSKGLTAPALAGAGAVGRQPLPHG